MSSPIDATCDLIDATCHQIILVGEDQSGCKDEIFKLAKRLNFYQNQLENMYIDLDGSDDIEQGVGLLKTVSSKCRYLMALLIVEVCAREAYTVGTCDYFQELIGLSCNRFNLMRGHLNHINQLMPPSVISSSKWKQSFGILDTQYLALATLTCVRDQLMTMRTEVKEGIVTSSIGQHVRQVSEMKSDIGTLNFAVDPLIKATLDRMLFIVKHDRFMELRNTKKELIKCVNSLIDKIDVGQRVEVAPLHEIQAQLRAMVVVLGESLPLPTLVELGYFS